MTDRYIDADETQVYGAYTPRQIRERIVPLIPAFAEAMAYLATEIETATATVKAAIDASRQSLAGVREGTRSKRPLLKDAKNLLGRFSKHLDGHKPTTIDRKTFFTRDGTATGVGHGAHRVLQAVVHISTELSRDTCPVQARADWLAEFREIAANLAPVVEHSDNIKSERLQTTPEVVAAREGWLRTYLAAKCAVEGVLRLSGSLHLMPVVFYDLTVPATAKVTEAPPAPPAEPADPDAPV
jgi:hypothetical protein